MKKCKKFDNSEKFEFRAKLIKYYITQAKEHYLSAKKVSVLTKPTLLYYCDSCLVKTLILTKRCYQDDSTDYGIKIHKSNANDLLSFLGLNLLLKLFYNYIMF